MYGLDLFSGYGGISIALSEWVKPVAYCEIERYAQGILLSRMAEGKIPMAPIWDDIKTFRGEDFRDKVDIIYGGFPCQDISVAGNGKGLEGKRSGLFYELCGVVKEVKPSFVFLENVPAIRTRGLREVVISLTNLGYDCRWTCVSAKEVGAPHLRKRWFMLAYSNGKRGGDNSYSKQERRGSSEKRETLQCEDRKTYVNPSKSLCENMANTNGSRCKEQWWESPTQKEFKAIECNDWWKVEPDVGRVVDGCANRVDRIKSLGNGVVPLQVKEAFKRLMGF